MTTATATDDAAGSKRVTTRLTQVAPQDLAPHPRNSRIHAEGQLEEIRASIRRFGFVRPVLANADRVVLAGHGARLGAIAEGLAKIPVVLVSGLTDEEERGYVIADNRLAEKSKWDWDLLAAEFADLASVVSLHDIGFSEWREPATGGEGREIHEGSLDGEHRCPRCGFEWT